MDKPLIPTKSPFQTVKREVDRITKMLDIANAMDMRISQEFTPDPDYKTPIMKCLKSNGWGKLEFMQALSPEESYHFHCLTQ